LSRQNNQENSAMRYVLGTLPDAERVRLEERYFSDDTEFEEIEIAEEELIDRYIRGELSRSDCSAFEQAIARSPRLMERVEFAKLFAEKLRVAEAPVKAEKTNWWEGLFGFSHPSRGSRLAFAFSMLLVLVAGGALSVGWFQLRAESRRLAAQKAFLDQRQRELVQQSQPTPFETPVPPQETAPETNGAVVLLTLSPGATRSTGGANNLRIESETSEVELTLKLRHTDYSSYRVTINSPTRKDIFSKSGLKPRGPILTFRVPAEHLQQGDYYVSLSGGPANESVDDYPFRVIK
jgi:hypothetical protein